MHQLTEREYREGFWTRRANEAWPPPAIQSPEAYDGGSRLLFYCAGETSRQSRNAEHAWTEVLPTMTDVRFLWITGTFNESLVQAVSAMPSIEGLWAKSSNAESLDPLWKVEHLRFVSIVNCTRLRNIEAIARARHLAWVELENAKHIRDLTPVGDLTQLEGFAFRGSMWTPHTVESLTPIGGLTNLRSLRIESLRSNDRTLRPLFSLRKLRRFGCATWWPADEIATVKTNNPGLAG